MTPKKFLTPEGYEALNQTENHIGHIGQGFYKRNEEGNLVMAFWVRPENGNSGGVAHGGMLMSIADYCLCSVAMESRENYAATISFRAEFVAPAKVGSLVEIYSTITKETKSLAFGEGQIMSEGEVVFSFSGIVKKITK
tara:strand:+ start:385 stop:801 length:417 start_codon:yes stop_codon:yes gene_type:complete